MPTPAFTDLLKLIEDRSAALRAAARQSGPDARVPGCPDWSVRDLVAHLGEVQRFWAAVVAAGPAQAPPPDEQLRDRALGDDLLGWSAAATGELVRALAEVGPDRPCWTWWQESAAPMDSGAVARHQLQEAAVHAFDAQEAAGRPEVLPGEAAADGVGEFLTVGLATLGAWPHAAGRVELAADGGPRWLVDLSASGAKAREVAPGPDQAEPDARIRGSASDLVLALYGRHLPGSLDIEGDQELAARLLSWAHSQ